MLPKIIYSIDQPRLFWLDAYYSEEIITKDDLYTPIISELTGIFLRPTKDHVILIDDMRYFTDQNDYTLIKDLKGILRKFVLKECLNLVFKIKDDIIRIHR